MRKSLKRVLERLRTATNGRFRKPTSVRGDLQQQRLHVGLIRAHARPRG